MFSDYSLVKSNVLEFGYKTADLPNLSFHYLNARETNRKKMKAKEPIPYGFQEIDKQDIIAVSKVLQSDFLTTGPFVKKLKGLFVQFL